MKLGDYIKQYRDENNLSLREFANKTNLSHSYIGFLEKNIDRRTGKEMIPSLRTLKEIAKATNNTPDELLELLDEEQEFSLNWNENEGQIINKENLEKDKKEIMKTALIKAGFMQEGKDLTNEELERLISFVDANKKFIFKKEEE